ncbi:hypothetical protein D3C85_488100 [compost metagenome]
MKNPRNRNHKEKRVVSKSKFQRILKKNLDSTGYAYIITDLETYEVKRSLHAVVVGKHLYAKFMCKDFKKGCYYIRYSLDPEDSCDFVAFQYYPNGQKALMEIINAE